MLYCWEAKTQTDYITNGSFEKIDSCYGTTAGPSFDIYAWSGCSGWSNPKAGTPDLWCQSPITWTVVPPAIPTIGFQYPKTGNNMAGLFQGFSSNNSYYGEYIQNKLINTLKKDYMYSIEFYLSKGFSPCTISQIGVKFFTAKYYDPSLPYWYTNTISDVENSRNTFILDTLGWQKISLQYKANGTENYIIIGSFADSLDLIFVKPDLTLCDSSGGIYPSVYFFIDDVSVIEQEFEGEVLIPNVFTPNNDKSNDVWYCDLSSSEKVNCTIYNRWGLKVFETSNNVIAWDGLTAAGTECIDGIYFYCIETETEKYKGHIQLLR